MGVPEGAPTPEDLSARLPEYGEFRCIGSGAMGVVYQAWHRPLERHVALKVLSSTLTTRALTVRRFFLEARAMARISHPNIVPVYEVAADGEFPYFTMELVQGGSLKDLLQRKGVLAPRRAAEIACAIAGALAHAHDEGILHRDVKPGNVLLGRSGTPRLTDFGLVRRTDSATITASDAIVGTPQYMSPEQVRGDSLDGRSDLFSLGSTLYEMLVGHPPFRADNPVGVLRAIVDQVPESIRKQRPQVTSGLEAVVMRMLEKDPDRRYAHLDAARADLQRYLDGEAVEATLPSSLSRAWRRLRSNRLAMRFALALLLLAGVGAVYITATEYWITQSNRFGTLVNRASAALRAGDWQQAETFIEGLTPEERGLPEILMLHAQVAERAGDTAAAHDKLARAIELEPGNEDYLSKAADLAAAAGNPKRALDWLDRLEELQPAGDARARRAEIAWRRVVVNRGWAEASVRKAAESEGQIAPSPLGVSVALVPLEPGRAARRELAAAILRVDAALENLDLVEDLGGRTLETEMERALLHGLAARLEADGAERERLLRSSVDEILGLRNRADFARLSSVYQVDLPRYMLEMNQELARAENDSARRAALDQEVDKWRLMYTTASSVVDSARTEVEGSFRSIVTPAPRPVAGPLGRARDAVNGLISGILGGSEEGGGS